MGLTPGAPRIACRERAVRRCLGATGPADHPRPPSRTGDAMRKKLFTGIVPLLAVAAFAVVPAAAQAEPHWYKKLHSSAHPRNGAHRRDADAQRPVGIDQMQSDRYRGNLEPGRWWGRSGRGHVVRPFGMQKQSRLGGLPERPDDCQSRRPAVAVAALPTPPPNSVIRDEIAKVRLRVGCAGTSGTVGDEFEGSLTPEVGNGVLIFGGRKGARCSTPSPTR